MSRFTKIFSESIRSDKNHTRSRKLGTRMVLEALADRKLTTTRQNTKNPVIPWVTPEACPQVFGRSVPRKL